MESESKQTKPEPVFFTEIVEAFESLRSSELKTRDELAERDEALAQLSDKIRTRGAQRGAELRVGLILAAGNNEMIKQGMNSLRLLTRLQKIDEKLWNYKGQTIAWLDEEEVITGRRDSELDATRTIDLFNLGILPSDAKVQVSAAGEFSIPVARHVSIKLGFAQSGREVDFNKKNILPGFGLHEQKVATDPEEITLPLPALLSPRNFVMIGNDEVEKMIEDNQLQDDPYIYFAASALLKFFKEAHPLEPELPPAVA